MPGYDYPQITICSCDEGKSIKNQIEQLTRAKNAVILAHYYAPADVQ